MRTLFATALWSLAFAAHADEEVAPMENSETKVFDQIRDRLSDVQSLIDSRSVKIKTKAWTWEELDRFQTLVWKSMALDPARLDSRYIPPELEPEALTKDLRTELDKLIQTRFVAERYRVEAEFDEYVLLVQEIVELREKQLYSRSRHIAKKGLVDGLYANLAKKLANRAQSEVELSVTWDRNDRKALNEQLAGIRGDLKNLANHYEEAGKSMNALTPPTWTSLQKVLWVLMPLLFLTGFIGGLAWNRGGDKKADVLELDPHASSRDKGETAGHNPHDRAA